ncbi:hypothetical protein [Pelistega europaea]|uniref:Uncharacterized protein n=1 Tax=Pelistega europaea TaxID=106147 RepID=A0A7Y4L988_9BURK|nr:hypothetical protein [Pelistega europaea]NOL49263.1 hypothetical protein [Pelistega europaea]
MGFLNTLAKTIEAQHEKMEKIKNEVERLKYKSNDELLSIAKDSSFFGASQAEKQAARYILNKRRSGEM